MEHLRRCPKCLVYTLNSRCPKCHAETASPHPAKFSLLDKYSHYRLEEKKKLLREKGLY